MSEIAQLENKLADLGNRVGRLQGEYNALVNDQVTTAALIGQYKYDEGNYKQAVELMTAVQAVTRDKVKDKFELLVSYALKFITEEDYKFVLDFDKRGNLGELDFKIIPPGSEEAMNPIDQSGEGIKDTIGVALRAVLLEVSNPKINGFLVLDETFKQLSAGNLPAAWNFINELNKRLGRQIIFITHQKIFIDNSDNIIEIK